MPNFVVNALSVTTLFLVNSPPKVAGVKTFNVSVPSLTDIIPRSVNPDVINELTSLCFVYVLPSLFASFVAVKSLSVMNASPKVLTRLALVNAPAAV